MMPLTSSFPKFIIIRGDIMEVHKICPVCNKEFIITHTKDNCRKYCFDCSPAGRGQNYLPLYHSMKHRLIELRGGACERCGYNKCEDALCFHHKDPTQKEFVLSMQSRSKSWEDWKAEADKCMLLCLNCHAEMHEELRNNIE